jgi:tetratricopeptide (TPR) repeat protein
MTKNSVLMLCCLCVLPAFAAGESTESARVPATTASPAAASLTCPQAIPALERAIAADPSDAKLHNRLGVCYQQEGQAKRARGEFETAVKLDGGYAEAWNNLATLDHADRKYARAIKNYRRAIKARPDFAIAFKNMGTAYLAHDDVVEGLAAYREALRLQPTIFDQTMTASISGPGLDAGTQLFYLAKLFAASGRVDVALDLLSKARAAGFRDFSMVRHDGDFQAVVADARFGSIAR